MIGTRIKLFMKNKKLLTITIIIFIIIILLTIFFLSQSSSSISTPKAIINGKTIILEIATTPLQQEQGLMYRKNLNENSGMLFPYSEEQIRYFWMKNTLISLDIIFIDSDYNIVDIESAEPCKKDPCNNYISKYPAKYVLEVNSGYTQINNISVGDKIDLRFR